MAKWVRYIFRGSAQDGSTFTMSGPAYRGLALVRIATGVWSLTHMKTGVRVSTLTGDYVEVRRLAEAIAEVADWESFETREAAVAEPGLAERIAAVAAFHGYGSWGDAGHA